MNDRQLIDLAYKFCEKHHKGQFRKGSNLPYASHPTAVAEILDRYGFSDPITQCTAILHDVVEDTKVITGEINERFGYQIANGVFVLSKNTISQDTVNYVNMISSQNFNKEDLYKLRLSFARRKVKRVKIADITHNTTDLVNLTPEGIARKIHDAESFYIPMGREIAPLMIEELEENINIYKQMTSSQNCQ